MCAPTSSNACRSERATREWRTSPTIATWSPSSRPSSSLERVEVEQRLRRVLVLAVAGVDDVGVGDPGDELRRADLRVPDHDHVRVVGAERERRVLERLALVDRGADGLDVERVRGEPLRGELEARRGARRGLVEEVDDEVPLRASAASSRAGRASRRSCARCRAGARRRRGSRSATEIRWRRGGGFGGRRSSRTSRTLGFAAALIGSPPRRSGTSRTAVDLVDLDELHLDPLGARGRQVLADVVGADRQLAVAAVDEDGELDARGAAVVEERLDRGPDRAAGVEDVVDEDDRAPVEREVELGGADERLRRERRLAAADGDVVAVEGDVDGAERGRVAGALLDQPGEPVRERDAAGLDADEGELVELRVALDDLVRDARQRPGERRRRRGGPSRTPPSRSRRGRGRRGRDVRGHSDSFPASRDRLKGGRAVDGTLAGRHGRLAVDG